MQMYCFSSSFAGKQTSFFQNELACTGELKYGILNPLDRIEKLRLHTGPRQQHDLPYCPQCPGFTLSFSLPSQLLKATCSCFSSLFQVAVMLFSYVSSFLANSCQSLRFGHCSSVSPWGNSFHMFGSLLVLIHTPLKDQTPFFLYIYSPIPEKKLTPPIFGGHNTAEHGKLIYTSH